MTMHHQHATDTHRYASLPAFQSFGDAGATMGIIYASVGIGCCMGPLLLNAITPTALVPLLRGVALSMALLLVGYLLMLVATHIYTLMLATVVRAMGRCDCRVPFFMETNSLHTCITVQPCGAMPRCCCSCGCQTACSGA